jgi:hypothetical protein
MIADDFHKGASQPGRFAFGVGAADVAAGLRKLAEAIERGEVLLQETRTIVRSKTEEFTMSSLIIRYAEKR